MPDTIFPATAHQALTMLYLEQNNCAKDKTPEELLELYEDVLKKIKAKSKEVTGSLFSN